MHDDTTVTGRGDNSQPATWAYAGYLAAVLVSLGVGYAGSAVTAGPVGSWYPGLLKPPGTPPNLVFPVVWTTLYVMMGMAAGRAWSRSGIGDRRAVVAVFAVQLFLNFAWSFLFFGLQMPAVALVEIAVLWAAIATTIVIFGKRDTLAGLLLIPYLAWVTFASYLNAGIWYLNR